MKIFRGKRAMAAGLIIMICGIIAILAVAGAINTHQTAPSIAYNDEATVSDGQIYEFKNAVVFNEYAITDYGDAQIKEHFYIIGKFDKASESWVLYNLCMNEDNELFKTLDAYSKDANTQVGDLTVSYCARATDINKKDHEIRSYFVVAADEYNDKAFSGEARVCNDFEFTYTFDSASDVAAYNRSNAAIKWTALGIIIAVTVLGTLVFYRNLRHLTRGEI